MEGCLCWSTDSDRTFPDTVVGLYPIWSQGELREGSELCIIWDPALPESYDPQYRDTPQKRVLQFKSLKFARVVVQDMDG